MARPLSYEFDPETSYVKTASGYSVPGGSAVNTSQKLSIYQQLPLTAPAASVLSTTPATITFRLDKTMRDNIHYLQVMALKFNVTNTDGINQLKLVDGYSLIDHITFSVGNQPIQTLYGPQIREDLLMMMDSDSKGVGATDAAGIDYETGLSVLNIAANGSQEVIVDIFECFATTSNFPLCLLPSDLQIDLTLRYGGNQCLATGSAAAIGAASLTNMTLLLAGETLSPKAIDRVYRDTKAASPVIFRFVDHAFQSLPLGSITANTPAPSAQFNIQGKLAMINVNLVNNAAATGDVMYYQTGDIKALDFLDGNTIKSHNLGTLSFTSTMFEALSTAWLPSQKTIAALNRFYVLFDEKIAETIRSGADWGHYDANGSNLQIQILPGVSIANAALYCYAVRYSSLLVEISGDQISLRAAPGNIGV